MCRDMAAPIDIRGSATGDLQIEDLGIVAHKDTVQLTQRRNARRVFIERPQGKIVGDLIHHVATQVLREVIESATQRIWFFQARAIMPFLVHESKNAIAPLWCRIQSASKLNRTLVGP